MKSFIIPPLHFSLQSSEGSFRNYKRRIEKLTVDLSEKEKKVGTAGTAFNNAYRYLKKTILEERKSITTVVTEPIHIRALAKLITAENLHISEDDLKHLITIRSRPSLLLLSSLTGYFFRYYDQLPNITSQKLGSWLLDAYRNRKKTLSTNDEKLFSGEAVDWLLRRTKQMFTSLDEIVKIENLSPYKSGRLYQLLQMTYYVEQLNELEPNEENSLLDEIVQSKVYEAPYKDGKQLGHEILEILIDKIQSDVSDRWREVVLKIAGDPRVPKDAQNYRNWWLVLGDQRITKVRGWLSKVDIELFLKVFDEYAQYKHDEGMIRMYPARKTFLLGLLNQKRVLNTRLYLSSNIQNFIKDRLTDNEKVPINTTLMSADMAVIYLDIGNGLTMIEGTHSFKCHIYKDIADSAVVNNYSRREVQKSTLMKLPCYKLEAISHRGFWQHRVIEQLDDLGFHINPETVLTKSDYKDYKRRFGMPLQKYSKPVLSSVKVRSTRSTLSDNVIRLSEEKTVNTTPLGADFKTCSKCGKTLHINQFYKSSKNSDNLTKWCKICLNELTSE